MRLLLLLALVASLAAPASSDSASEAFFRRMLDLDGRVFTGATIFPTDPADDMVGKPLELRFQAVSADELRVPFRVGDDASRTWILRRTPEGLLLKHDHGHDPITNYGGVAVPGLMSGLQVFPADAETAAMIPAASTNVWALQLSPDGRSLAYSLERHQAPRFEARFGLSDSGLFGTRRRRLLGVPGTLRGPTCEPIMGANRGGAGAARLAAARQPPWHPFVGSNVNP